MNLRPAGRAWRQQTRAVRRGLEAMFLLDFAARALQDFVRAFSTEERLVSPGIGSLAPGKRLALACPGVHSTRAGWCGIKRKQMQEER